MLSKNKSTFVLYKSVAKSRILLDSSFLIDLKSKELLESFLSENFGKVEFYITSSVLDELEKMAKTKFKAKRALLLLKSLTDLKIINSNKKADESILEVAKKIGAVVATNDKELRKKLKELGIKTLSTAHGKIKIS